MYVFTNHFSGSSLHHRVRMINRRRSGYRNWGRYVLWVTGVVGVAFGCQFIGQKQYPKYVQQTDDELFALITAHSTPSNLDTLRRVLHQQGVKLRYDKVVPLPDGRIRQIELSATVSQTGHAIHTSVGSPYGQEPIRAVGLRLKESRLRVSSVNDEFPRQLRELAAREDNRQLDEVTQVNLKRDANTVLGLYRTFYRNDFMESNYFGLRTTLVRMTPDYHLDLYPEFTNAVVFLDGKEISRDQLRQVHVLDLRKLVVYRGNAAKLRYGNQRAQQGLVLVTSRQNQYVRNHYATTPLLREVYPKLFAKY